MNICQLCKQHYNDAHAACSHCSTPAGMVANLERALVLLEAVQNIRKDEVAWDCLCAISYVSDARWRLLPYTGQHNEVST